MLAKLILLLPFLGFIFSFFSGKKLDVRFSQYITSIFIILSAIFSWVIFFQILGSPAGYKIELFNWINSGSLKVNWSLKIDTLSTVMLIVVTNISAAVHVYSIGYMSKDPSIPRFMSYLSLFLA